jgi:hypothetical protein
VDLLCAGSTNPKFKVFSQETNTADAEEDDNAGRLLLPFKIVQHMFACRHGSLQIWEMEMGPLLACFLCSSFPPSLTSPIIDSTTWAFTSHSLVWSVWVLECENWTIKFLFQTSPTCNRRHRQTPRMKLPLRARGWCSWDATPTLAG